MTEIHAVVFDLDGTLLDHVAAATTSVREWLGSAGLAAEAIEPLIPVWFALEDKHYEAYRAGEASLAEQRRRRMRDFLPLVGRGVEEDGLDTTFAGYLARYEANWVGYPDAARAVQAVRDLGVRTAVLTNGDQDQQTRKLATIGLVDTCGPVFASSSLGAAKPDPRAYAAVCSQLGVAPEQAVMVGDNYELDVLAARRAGLRGIHLDREASHDQPERHRITTLDELPPALAALARV